MAKHADDQGRGNYPDRIRRDPFTGTPKELPHWAEAQRIQNPAVPFLSRITAAEAIISDPESEYLLFAEALNFLSRDDSKEAAVALAAGMNAFATAMRPEDSHHLNYLEAIIKVRTSHPHTDKSIGDLLKEVELPIVRRVAFLSLKSGHIKLAEIQGQIGAALGAGDQDISDLAVNFLMDTHGRECAVDEKALLQSAIQNITSDFPRAFADAIVNYSGSERREHFNVRVDDLNPQVRLLNEYLNQDIEQHLMELGKALHPPAVNILASLEIDGGRELVRSAFLKIPAHLHLSRSSIANCSKYLVSEAIALLKEPSVPSEFSEERAEAHSLALKIVLASSPTDVGPLAGLIGKPFELPSFYKMLGDYINQRWESLDSQVKSDIVSEACQILHQRINRRSIYSPLATNSVKQRESYAVETLVRLVPTPEINSALEAGLGSAFPDVRMICALHLGPENRKASKTIFAREHFAMQCLANIINSGKDREIDPNIGLLRKFLVENPSQHSVLVLRHLASNGQLNQALSFCSDILVERHQRYQNRQSFNDLLNIISFPPIDSWSIKTGYLRKLLWQVVVSADSSGINEVERLKERRLLVQGRVGVKALNSIDPNSLTQLETKRVIRALDKLATENPSVAAQIREVRGNFI